MIYIMHYSVLNISRRNNNRQYQTFERSSMLNIRIVIILFIGNMPVRCGIRLITYSDIDKSYS